MLPTLSESSARAWKHILPFDRMLSARLSRSGYGALTFENYCKALRTAMYGLPLVSISLSTLNLVFFVNFRSRKLSTFS